MAQALPPSILLPTLTRADEIRARRRAHWSAPDAAPDATPEEIDVLVESDLSLAIVHSMQEDATSMYDDHDRARALCEAMIRVASNAARMGIVETVTRPVSLLPEAVCPHDDGDDSLDTKFYVSTAYALCEAALSVVESVSDSMSHTLKLQWDLICAAAVTRTEIR